MRCSFVFAVFLFLASTTFGQSAMDDFTEAVLDPSWVTFKEPERTRISLAENPGFLRLKGSTVTLDDSEVGPALVARLMRQNNFEATVKLGFNPARPNETAGLDIRQNERRHYEFGIRRTATGREIYLRCVIGTVRTITSIQPIPDGIVELRIRAFPKYYRFSYAFGADEFKDIGGVESLNRDGDARDVYVGMFSSGNGIESTSNADFDWFKFNSQPKDPYSDLVVNEPTLPKGYTIFSVATAEKGIIEKYPFIVRPSSFAPDEVEEMPGLVYAKYGEREMHVDLFRPRTKGKHPAVVVVHGGAWITGNYTMEDPLAIALAKRGYIAITVEHRLSREKKYPAQIYDLKAAVRWLRSNAAKFGVDVNRIGAVGASSGGHLVALLGSTNGLPKFEGDGGNAAFSSRVQSVVDIDGTATFIDPGNIAKEIKGPYDTNTQLTGFTYAQNPDIWADASPISHVGKMSAPTLFLNSSSFRPFQQREEMCSKLKQNGLMSEIIVVPDTPHPFWLFRPWFDVTVDNIDAFFKKTMKPSR
ncbi:hypothetical protein BH10ACI2_BH10ACI2_03290 [soil metagenome]